MKTEDKPKYQLTDQFGSRAVAIDSDLVPKDVLKEICPEFWYDVLSFDGEKVVLESMIFFRKVKEFRKSAKVFEKDDIIFGV